MRIQSKIKGFTLIELIIVIILISIVSAVGMALFPTTQQYASRLIADQWLLSFRLAQRLALTRQNATELLTLSTSDVGGEWLLTISQGATTLDSVTIDKVNVTAKISNIDFVSSCDNLTSAAFPVQWYFNGYGDHVTAARAQMTGNTRICFTDTNPREMCISPSGYSYEGSCL